MNGLNRKYWRPHLFRIFLMLLPSLLLINVGCSLTSGQVSSGSNDVMQGSSVEPEQEDIPESVTPMESQSKASMQPVNPSEIDFSGEVDGYRYQIHGIQHLPTPNDETKILGNVTNVGDREFMFTRYTADFYDAAGNVVASWGPVRVSSDIHPVGVTLPIWFYVEDSVEWDNYDISVSERGAELSSVDAQLLDLSLSISGSVDGSCETYTVTNDDDRPASWLSVISRVYDVQGNLIGAYSDGISTRFLMPGETSSVMPCDRLGYPYDMQVIGYYQPNQHE